MTDPLSEKRKPRLLLWKPFLTHTISQSNTAGSHRGGMKRGDMEEEQGKGMQRGGRRGGMRQGDKEVAEEYMEEE